ncbi:MAG: FAD-dependent oxidoreductase [Pseudomonadota bacterium]
MPDALPQHAAAVVIGGGIMGCATLYHLAEAGVDAILIERNKLTSGTTWHSAAQFRALRSTKNLTELIRYSVDLYARLEAETGQATGWICEGSLSIATSADRLTHIRRQEALAQVYGVRAWNVSPGEAAERWPLMRTDDVLGAVWSPDDGRVSPSDLCAALIKGAKARGARVFEDTAVTGIRTDRDRVTGIETSQGIVACDAAAICTGLWSRQIAALGGVDVPLYPCEHFYLLTQPIDGIHGNLPTLSDHDAHLYIRDDSGGLLVGCFEPMGKAIAPEVLGEDFAFQLLPEDWEHFEPMMENALHRLPPLAAAGVRMLLNGPESFTPDSSFLLGETAETRGLYLGCGMNSVGVATGGGAGMALARAIAEGAMPVDLGEADPARFPACWNSAAALAARAPEVLGKHYEIAYPGRQYRSARGLRKGPLDDQHRAAGAVFSQVFGWERPMFFADGAPPKLSFGRPDWHDRVAAEVDAAHREAAVFDLSSFGKIAVSGTDAAAFLDRVCANKMNRPVGRAIYTQMLNALGGIVSDLTAVRLGPDDYRLSVGTSAVKRDMAWLTRQQVDGGFKNVTLTDVTEDFAVIGLMGPQAASVAEAAGAVALSDLGYFRAGKVYVADVPVTAVRLSYVGEAGCELTCPAADATRLWQALVKAGARPAGTLAQTAMRIEKRFLSFGHELDTDISPLQAGLGFTLGWDTDFIGRDALLAQRNGGAQNRLVSLVLDDADAWPHGHEPVRLGDQIVGKTTSAAFGFRVGRPVAIADLSDHEARAEGARVLLDVGGDPHRATVTNRPAFDPDGSRMRG